MLGRATALEKGNSALIGVHAVHNVILDAIGEAQEGLPSLEPSRRFDFAASIGSDKVPGCCGDDCAGQSAIILAESWAAGDGWGQDIG
jgi:hypothetical protein